MNAYKANLLNAVVLIVMGLWGYFASENPSPTAFIPVAFGLILGLMSPGVKNENKIIAHLVVVLTLLIIIAMAAMPLKRALTEANNMAILRIGVMLLTSVIAMVYFIKSFIDARKKRTAENS